MFLAVSSRADRRQFPRMRLECPMVFREVGQLSELDGFARSVSGGGLLFDSGVPLERGMVLEVTVRPPLMITEPLHAILEVTRCDENEDGYRVAGLFRDMLSGE